MCLKKVQGSVPYADEKVTTFKCLAEDATPSGAFHWLVGGEEQPNTHQKLDLGDGKYSQEFGLLPQVKHDGKSLTCR